MLKIAFLLVSTIAICSSADINNINLQQSTPYKKLDYQAIQNTFKDFVDKYPNLIRLKYINDESKIDFSQVKCGQGLKQTNCLYFYAEITDFTQNEALINSLPQVLFTGSLLGNNTIGPNIVTYLAEYLLKNSKSKKIGNLLSERVVIVYPIPNPQGFSSFNSMEVQQNGQRINVESDFPYFLSEEEVESSTNQLDCLQSVSAKTLTYLFSKYLFTIGASFGLGEIPSIQYPMPSVVSAIDQNIQDTITSHLQNNSPSNIKMFTSKYAISQLQSSSQKANTFYEWANIPEYSDSNFNGADSSISKLPLCKGVSLSQQSISEFSNKCLLYKIECNKLEPSEQNYGDRESSSNIYSDKVGHVARNIQLSLELIEMASPYISTSTKVFSNHNVYLEWQVGGCFVVNQTSLYYRVKVDNSANQKQLSEYRDIESIEQDFTLIAKYTDTTGALVSDQNKLYHTWTFDNSTLFEAIIIATCDQQWKSESDNLSHNPLFVQLRTNSTLQVQNNGYSLTQKNLMIKLIPSIQSVQVNQSAEQLVKIQKEQAHKQTFQFWIGILIGLALILILSLSYYLYKRCKNNYQDTVDLKLLNPKLDALELSSNQTHVHNTSEVNQLNLTKQVDIDMSRADNDFSNFANLA